MFQANGYGRIGVLMGGNSSERSISLRSGEAVITALRQKSLQIVPLDVQGSKAEMLNKIREAEIAVAFIALHGRGGEDGFIQRLLQELAIPYIGTSPEGSERAFNKLESKKVFESAGIPTPKYVLIDKKNWAGQMKEFPFPVFVKPLDEGSSIGVKKIGSFERMKGMIPELFRDYENLLAEEAILGRELTVGLLGDRALPVIELKPKREFYDYTAKYTKGMTEYLIPAPISANTAANLQEISVRAFRQLGLRDFSRVDFMMDAKEQPYVLEVNTIPGFTETSLLPKAARAAGIEFGDLCLTLLQFAKERACSNGKKK